MALVNSQRSLVRLLSLALFLKHFLNKLHQQKERSINEYVSIQIGNLLQVSELDENHGE